MKKFAFLITVLAVFAIATTPASAASKGFKTGTYTASGDVSFKFKVYKGSCYHSGTKKRSGYCLSGISSTTPKLQMICPQVQGGVKDFQAFAFLPNQKWIPKSGKIRIKFTNPIRTDETDTHTFNLTLKKNGRASGNLSLSAQRKSISVVSTCESGVKNFTAKR